MPHFSLKGKCVAISFQNAVDNTHHKLCDKLNIPYSWKRWKFHNLEYLKFIGFLNQVPDDKLKMLSVEFDDKWHYASGEYMVHPDYFASLV